MYVTDKEIKNFNEVLVACLAVNYEIIILEATKCRWGAMGLDYYTPAGHGSRDNRAG